MYCTVLHKTINDYPTCAPPSPTLLLHVHFTYVLYTAGVYVENQQAMHI